MRSITIELGKEKLLQGFITMNIPDPVETKKLLHEYQFKIVDGQTVERSDDEKYEYMFQLVEKQCVHVNLKNKQGAELKSVDDLKYDEDGRLYLNEMGGMCFKGVPMSPKSLNP